MVSKIIKFVRKNALLLILMIGVVLFSSENAKAVFPVISNTGSSSVTSVSAVVTWQTDVNSNSLVDFGTTTSYGNTLGDSGESVMSHSVNLTGLNPDTTYKYRVRSKNGGDETIDDNGGVGYEFTTAASPVISNVRLSVMNDTFVTITWQTSTNAYPFVAYGTTTSYGKLVGDEENLGTSHSISIAGVTPGTVYHYLPRVKDIYGNYTNYGVDNTFTLGAPHLQSFTSGTADGIYGPSSTVNITANYSENLEAGSTATVVLDNGVSVTLDSISGSTLSGTYTVGATGSGEDSSALNVSSITSQSVCDVNSYCYSGTTLPVTNINSGSAIVVDTTAPAFSAVSPASSTDIDSVTTASDISYTLSENLSSGTILITRTLGSADAGSPHTCTLSGIYLNAGSHNSFDTINCVEGAITLVDGATYSFEFNGSDLAGNSAGTVARSGVTFDTSNPVLQAFSSTTTDGIYGPSRNINVTANYDENLSSGSTATVVLDTGISVTLDSISGSTLSGTYTIGATSSGENSSALNVSSIFSQNACDEAGNCQTATTLPGTNINNGATLIIDTNAPVAPSEVSFVTNPVNSSNENNATLRVTGEAEATIFYSIDDGDAGTGAVEGNAVMEADGSTDITGINLIGLTDGSLTATVYLRDIALNSGASSQGVVIKDTANPEFTIQYYSDSGLLSSLGDNPSLDAGTYYLKITSNEALSDVPTISIDAEGTANDVSSAVMTAIGGNEYSYTRVISYEVLAIGSVLENISISGTDSNSNSVINADPTNEISKAGYTDTVKPTVTGTVLPAIAGTVSGANVSLTFNEAMNQAVSPEVLIRKSDASTLVVSGSFVSDTAWQGTVTLSAGDANGVAVLEVSLASDTAGNVMDSNTNVDDFVIDTADPVLTVVEGTDVGPVKNDTINITTSDTGSGVSGQYYGFSADSVCDGSDTIDTAFTSGIDFVISGNHADYLCAKVEDNAGNISYATVGQLNTDNSSPTIDIVSSNHANGAFTVGEIIDIDVTFSEPVTSTGDVTVTLETGTVDRSCTFAITDSIEGTCDYIVQAGDTSLDLNVNSISGTIEDQTGNSMTDFTSITNLADNKNIIIDTTAPVVNITAPLGGERVNSNFVITFDNNETTSPECSIDNTNWVYCSSGSTTLSDLIGWTTLPDGNFTLYLRDTDGAGNTGSDSEVDIFKDTAAPTIDSVSSDVPNGNYKEGQIIDIDVFFSEPVTSTGDVTVTLETGTIDRSCTFVVTNSTQGTCNYTVQAGDTSLDLNVNSISGTIEDQTGVFMTNFVPSNNLADNKNIVIDTTAPTIQNISSDKANGSYDVGDTIDVDVTFSEAVTSSSLVTVTLDSGGSCTFSAANNTLASCNYVVAEGQNSADLNVVSITGDLADQAGNAMTDMSIPSGHNLADNKDIRVDTTTIGDPIITNVTSDHANGIFRQGEVIDVDFTFSEIVTSSGFVTVTLDSGGSCTFTVTDATEGTCNYTVDSGQNSSDLNVAGVSGTIEDQAGNLMTNFTPTTNLADNKDIVIDTTAPNAPIVALTNPITDENRNNVSITGTGEGSTSINYSVDDENASTAPVTGSSSVSATGDISVTGIDLSSLDGGAITASVTLTDLAGNVSSPGEAVATSTVVRPTVSNITSDHANGAFTVGEVIDIDVTFSEAVTSAGNVTITLETGETDRNCTFTITDATEGTCNYTVQTGDTSSDLNVANVSGTIEDQAGNLMTNFTPITNLADNKNIVIDTAVPLIDSFISTTEDGTYASDSEINITAVYNENIESGSTIDVLLDNGVAVTLNTILESTKLVGTYTVGATGSGESTSDLEISSISSQNVCDKAGNCQTSTTLPSTNISSGSTIAVDTTAPIFHSISPENSENIDSVTTDSDISYSLSEDLASGTIEFTRTAWEEDPNSPHICTLEETFLYEGVHNSFDTSNCQEGVIELVDGSVYTIAFKGTDVLGNVASSIEKTGISFGMDKEAPIISNVVVSEITSKKATITWKTDEDSDSYVEYGLTADLGEVYGNKTLTKTHSIILPSILTHSSLYYYRVNSTDSYGNKAVSQIKTFNTLTTSSDEESGSGEGENIAGISSIEVSDTTSSSAIVTWETSEICNGIVRYGLDEEYGHSAAEDATIEAYSTFSNEHKVLLTGLFSNSTYNYKVVSYDIYGNISVSGNETFSTSSLSSVSGVKVENVTLNSATITWETGDPISSEVEYGLTTGYGETVEDETLTNYHKIEIANLQAGQTYHFRVKGATDDEGVVASDDYVFATYPKPQVNNHELVNITDNSATIKWKTNIPTEAVIEYFNIDNSEDKGVQGASEITDEHNVEILGLEQGSEYQVKIKGVDINKNDFESDSFSITTDKDVEPPIISDINIDTSLSSQKNDNVQAIVFWKTNELSTSQVIFNSGMDNAQGEFQEESTEDTNLTTNHLVVLTNLKPGMIYQFKTISKDKNENKGESEVYTVLTPRKEESVIQMIISNFQQTFGWMNKLKK